MAQQPIPSEVVLEFIGSVTFAHDGDKDCMIAENIAANSYNDMEQLISTCKGMTNDDEAFGLWVEECKDNDYFKPYFNKQ